MHHSNTYVIKTALGLRKMVVRKEMSYSAVDSKIEHMFDRGVISHAQVKLMNEIVDTPFSSFAN